MADRWIKALGMSAEGERLADDWGTVAEGLFHNAVTFAGRSGLRKGDAIVLYASGTGLFFAVGSVTSNPYLAEERAATGWPWRVNVELDRWRELVSEGVPLETLNVEDRDLRKSIQRRSHIRLSQAELDAAVSALA